MQSIFFIDKLDLTSWHKKLSQNVEGIWNFPDAETSGFILGKKSQKDTEIDGGFESQEIN